MTIPIVGSPAAIGSPLRVFIDSHDGRLIDVTDRGLHYGDGLFETIRVARGELCQWARHRARLETSLSRLAMGQLDFRQLHADACSVVAGVTDAVLKVMVTRGAGGRGYRPPSCCQPSTILLLYPPPADDGADWRDGVRVRICETPASMNPALAGMKHLNRLDSVLARQEWRDAEIGEGLMFDPTGDLVGGTMTNAFVWDGSTLITPPVDRCGIAGTVRALMIECAAQCGVPFREQRVQSADLAKARGIFLTNSVAPLWLVRELDGQQFDLSVAPWKLLERVREASLQPG